MGYQRFLFDIGRRFSKRLPVIDPIFLERRNSIESTGQNSHSLHTYHSWKTDWNGKNHFQVCGKVGLAMAKPVSFLAIGDLVPPENLKYVALERFFQALETAPLRWKRTMAFGQLASVRGSTELYKMA